MKVSIEGGSGFCSGVTRVIKMAEEVLDKGEKLYCLGEIVHNEKEIRRLIEKGIIFIKLEELKELKDTSVLIRAHGEPPSTYKICEDNNIAVLDGTCPIVKALQKKIKNAYIQNDPEKEQIVLYGKPEHPEVIGLNGQTDNNCIVVNHPDQISPEVLKKGVSLFSQTTMDSDGFTQIESKLNQITSDNKDKSLKINNTICKHISHRQPGILEFTKNNQLIIFVAGKNSSNGKILFEICRKENPNCKFISEPEELEKDWFLGIESVGVTGGTSTPGWLLKQVAKEIKAFEKQD